MVNNISILVFYQMKNIVIFLIALSSISCVSITESRNQRMKSYSNIQHAMNHTGVEIRKYIFVEKSGFRDKRVKSLIMPVMQIEYMFGFKGLLEIVNVIPISSTRECWRVKRPNGKLQLYKLRAGSEINVKLIESIDECT